MENIDIPKIELREPERLWLEALFDDFISGKKPTYVKIRAKLHKLIPINFHPKNMDRRLINYDGNEPTLIGILSIGKGKLIIEQGNKIILKIKKELINNPDLDHFSANELGSSLGIESYIVSLIFKMISRYGKFWTSASGNDDNFGFGSIYVKDDEVFDQYLHFTTIEDLINIYLKEERESLTHDPFLNFNKEKRNYIEQNTIRKQAINPIFRTQISQIDPTLCFVLMPFTEQWSGRVFKSYIRENIEALGIQCLRADNLTGPIIIEDIWIKINQAAFILADVTNKNPNVMYEMGIVHTLGKPAIIITQDVDNIPFDFKHLRHYHYVDNIEGLESFSSKIKSIIRQLYSDYYPDQLKPIKNHL